MGMFCVARREICLEPTDCGAGQYCFRPDETSGLCLEAHPDPFGTGMRGCLPGDCGDLQCVGMVDGRQLRAQCAKPCAGDAECASGQVCGAVLFPSGAKACMQACVPPGIECGYGRLCFTTQGKSFCAPDGPHSGVARSNAAMLFDEEPELEVK